MRISIEPKTLAGFACALLVSGLVGFLNFRAARQLMSEQHQAPKTEAVMKSLENVRTALEGVETEESEFVATKEAKHLEALGLARERVTAELGELARATTDNLA